MRIRVVVVVRIVDLEDRCLRSIIDLLDAERSGCSGSAPSKRKGQKQACEGGIRLRLHSRRPLLAALSALSLGELFIEV